MRGVKKTLKGVSFGEGKELRESKKLRNMCFVSYMKIILLD